MKEILIAESGSTKTEWRWCENGNITLAFRSPGINPTVQRRNIIAKGLNSSFDSHLEGKLPFEVHFYGSGLGLPAQRRVISDCISQIFPRTEVSVETDLLAAVRSTCREEGIVCILGTGSNVCYHRNDKIIARKGGHGYIVGDEGAGSDLGRHFIQGLLYNEFPHEVIDGVIEHAGMELEEIVVTIQKAAKPNVRLASLATLVNQYIHIEPVREMVAARFSRFLDTTVLHIPEHKHLPIDFVGSIGYHFQQILKDTVNQKGLQLGKIIKNPIDQLVFYHISHDSSLV